jgi:hypothetical protein
VLWMPLAADFAWGGYQDQVCTCEVWRSIVRMLLLMPCMIQSATLYRRILDNYKFRLCFVILARTSVCVYVFMSH